MSRRERRSEKIREERRRCVKIFWADAEGKRETSGRRKGDATREGEEKVGKQEGEKVLRKEGEKMF